MFGRDVKHLNQFIVVPSCLRRQARIMLYVYILKSEAVDWFYIGMSINVSVRLKQHNQKRVRSTKARAPYNLIYTKSFNDR